MSILEGKPLRYAADIALVYPQIDFDVLSDAPEEWIKIIYPDLRMIEDFGPNHKILDKIYEELEFNDARRDSLMRIITDFPDIHTTWPFDEFSANQFDAAWKRLKELIWFHIYALTINDDENKLSLYGKNLKPVLMVKASLLALQHRHLILNNFGNLFQPDDYAVLTLFLRTYWGELHPDD